MKNIIWTNIGFLEKKGRLEYLIYWVDYDIYKWFWKPFANLTNTLEKTQEFHKYYSNKVKLF